MQPRDVVEITTGVWVATSSLYQTTSTLIAREGGALLVDPAWTPDELEGLAVTIDDLGLSITSGYSTHAHYDHLLWHACYGEPPRWATARTVEVIAAARDAAGTKR